MVIKISSSEKIDLREAVVELKNGFGKSNPKLIIFFASSSYDPKSVSKVMKDAFKDASVIGCSTSGEIISGKMLKNSIVAMCIPKIHVKDVKVEILPNVNEKVDVTKAFNSFKKYYKDKMDNNAKMVGLVLTDGLSGAEEKVMFELSMVSNIPFIGGSAGDDLKFKSTSVFFDGKTYSNASILALLETNKGFSILKSQSFKPTGKTLIATDVDEKNRMIKKFNGKPALEAYAASIGKSKEDASNSFMHNPVGFVIDGTPFVRSPQRVDKNNIYFYCNVEKDVKLEVLESLDIIKHTRTDLNKKLKEVGDVAGIINFSCILRTLELEQKKQTKSYGNLFKNIPTIGFSTYGEAFMCHMNQTATILLLK